MTQMTKQTDTSASLLFWGPPFSGKTVLASQFPNPHVITFSDKHALTSVRGLRNQYKLDFDVDVIDIGEKEIVDKDFIDLCGAAAAKMPAWRKTVHLVEAWCRTLTENDTLIIDNISRMSEDLTRLIKKQTGKAKFTFDEWNMFLSEMQKMVECINHDERRCNIIIIGHEKPDEDQITGEIRRYLLLPGQMRHRIPSTITDYLYMKSMQKVVGGKRVTVRTLKSAATNDAQTGSRTLIPDIEYPTYAKMKPYLDAALGRELPAPNWTPPKDE